MREVDWERGTPFWEGKMCLGGVWGKCISVVHGSSVGSSDFVACLIVSCLSVRSVFETRLGRVFQDDFQVFDMSRRGNPF